jgi:hypothetical protein
VTGAEGAVIDPVTGDFLFSTFGTGTDRIIRVSGFAAPSPPGAAVPAPPAAVLALVGTGTLLGGRRLRRRAA